MSEKARVVVIVVVLAHVLRMRAPEEFFSDPRSKSSVLRDRGLEGLAVEARRTSRLVRNTITVMIEKTPSCARVSPFRWMGASPTPFVHDW